MGRDTGMLFDMVRDKKCLFAVGHTLLSATEFKGEGPACMVVFMNRYGRIQKYFWSYSSVVTVVFKSSFGHFHK